ncbi:MAG TPA: sigma-70 family RNA polymerase sigma factor [Thermoanaerobaculia bacterium]
MTRTDLRTSPDPADPGDDPGEEPFEKLLERIRPRLARMLRSYDIPLQDAEDLVQEAFLEALRKWDSIHYKDGWILGALRFKCSDYWKKQRSERVLSVDLPLLEELSPPQPPAQEQQEILLDLRRLTRGLSARQRAILWLRFGLGLSPGEVARRLGYRPSSIRKLAGRSMARLRRWANEGPNDPNDPSCP